MSMHLHIYVGPYIQYRNDAEGVMEDERLEQYLDGEADGWRYAVPAKDVKGFKPLRYGGYGESMEDKVKDLSSVDTTEQIELLRETFAEQIDLLPAKDVKVRWGFLSTWW